MKNAIAVSLNALLSVGTFLVLVYVFDLNWLVAFIGFVFLLVPASNAIVTDITGVDVLHKYFA